MKNILHNFFKSFLLVKYEKLAEKTSKNHYIHETKLVQIQKFVACNSSNRSHVTHCIGKSPLVTIFNHYLCRNLHNK